MLGMLSELWSAPIYDRSGQRRRFDSRAVTSGLVSSPEVFSAVRHFAFRLRGWTLRHPTHFKCNITVPSETVGAATPVLLAFLAIQSRATRMLSSVPALSS